ncbi:23S rRNA pseudouridine1911/1915/1917 synthase [Gracilibacillus orientalis]|uniref:Pseudouridine synthase n=1 Tax=Gracilibacillus orientalis TaxID=334253 RepID=A0A1I4IC32_9BACI|nr:RluA family pseudouridine synthase [Gracilibacillus orientalis]SFL51617.1 23S rRNA pseudouridine1911/1915/1917 synthase [Gracilibacillus orientalis]
MNLSQNPNMEKYEVDEPAELLTFLLAIMPQRSRNSVKSILTRGQVFVNNEEVTKHDFKLESGYTVTIQKNKAAKAATFEKMNILYEDDSIIVIEKDTGLLSVSNEKENSHTAYKQLMSYVRKINPKNRVYVVHRLDRDTSGVMLFAKSEKVKQTLQHGWKDMVKERSYVALVEGVLTKNEDTITSWLKENKTFKMFSSEKPNDGKEAITHYKVIKSNNNLSLLSVYLETGRKNQIRVHMADIGHPVVGDKKYGSKINPIGRLGLHAIVLAFKHPVTGELLRFKSNIPKVFLKKR